MAENFPNLTDIKGQESQRAPNSMNSENHKKAYHN